MKVSDLIEILKTADPDGKVVFGIGCGFPYTVNRAVVEEFNGMKNGQVVLS